MLWTTKIALLAATVATVAACSSSSSSTTSSSSILSGTAPGPPTGNRPSYLTTLGAPRVVPGPHSTSARFTLDKVTYVRSQNAGADRKDYYALLNFTITGLSVRPFSYDADLNLASQYQSDAQGDAEARYGTVAGAIQSRMTFDPYDTPLPSTRGRRIVAVATVRKGQTVRGRVPIEIPSGGGFFVFLLADGNYDTAYGEWVLRTP